MTLKQLSQLSYLMREIEHDKTLLTEIYAKATGSNSAITGMPHTSGVSDKVGKYGAEIAQLQWRIETNIQRCTTLRTDLEQYIFDIPDSLTRQIFRFRFMDGMEWEQVAEKVGGKNTGESVRKRVSRYAEEK